MKIGYLAAILKWYRYFIFYFFNFFFWNKVVKNILIFLMVIVVISFEISTIFDFTFFKGFFSFS